MKNGLILVLLCATQYTNAQNVGIGTNAPHASARLEVNATDKGILIPRMSSAQRTAIAAPAKGLQVFDNDTGTFWYFNGTDWVNMAPAPLTLPYAGESTSAIPGFTIQNNGPGAAIRGIGVSGPGIVATGNNGGLAGTALKVENIHANGIGVWSYTTSGDANMVVSNAGSGDIFRGFSGQSAGTLVYRMLNDGTILTSGKIGIGSSNTPAAKLEVNGTVRIADGSQGNGRVLSSDANGNASWKALPGVVAFRALNFNEQSLAVATDVPLNVTLEDFDWGSHFFASAFTAPTTGIFHFDAKLTLRLVLTENDKYSRFHLRLKKNGTIVEENVFRNISNSLTVRQSQVLSANIALNAGDVITISYYGDGQLGAGAAIADDVVFSGFRVN